MSVNSIPARPSSLRPPFLASRRLAAAGLVLLAAVLSPAAASAQEITTQRLDPAAEAPVGGVLAPVVGGGFVAAWSRGLLLSFGVDQVVPDRPVAVWLSASGEKITPIRDVAGEEEPATEPLAIASARPGEAVVVLRGEGDGSVVSARRISRDGASGPLHLIETCPPGGTFDLEVRGPAGYTLVCGGHLQALAADGEPVGPPVALAAPELDPSGARGSATPDGDLWVVWNQGAADDRRAFLRRLGPDLSPETPPVLFARLGGQDGPFPPIDVAALPGGGAAVIWVGPEGVALARLVEDDGSFSSAAPILVAPGTELPASEPRAAAARGTVAFSWRETEGIFPRDIPGYLRLVPVATGVPGDRIEVDHGFPGSLAFDAVGRLAILALEPRPLDFHTYLGPRIGVVPLAVVVPPPGEGVIPDAFSGFRVHVRIGGDEPDPRIGALEPLCLPETACFSGALSGRSEVLVRIVGPKPNGRLWPTIVRLTTSRVEVWIEQLATGERRYYLLEGATPTAGELDGLFDRFGFPPE
jgi:hypothetical protein